MQERMTKQDIQTILDRCKFKDRYFKLLDKGDGFLIQMTYLEPDIEHPNDGDVLQSTRKWYVSRFSTESEIVETVWACVCRSQIHTASEHFTYRGKRIYSQHLDVNKRLEICQTDLLDGRVHIEKSTSKMSTKPLATIQADQMSNSERSLLRYLLEDLCRKPWEHRAILRQVENSGIS